MIMPNLLLQKTSVKCKTTDMKKHIKGATTLAKEAN